VLQIVMECYVTDCNGVYQGSSGLVSVTGTPAGNTTSCVTSLVSSRWTTLSDVSYLYHVKDSEYRGLDAKQL